MRVSGALSWSGGEGAGGEEDVVHLAAETDKGDSGGCHREGVVVAVMGVAVEIEVGLAGGAEFEPGGVEVIDEEQRGGAGENPTWARRAAVVTTALTRTSSTDQPITPRLLPERIP